MRGNSAIKQELGFTLIEMMIALFILSVSILALTSVTITSIKVNLENDARNAAVRLTSEATDDLFAVDFSSLASGEEMRSVPLRGTTKDFKVQWTVTQTTATLREIVITVSYDIKGKVFTNRSVVYRPSQT